MINASQLTGATSNKSSSLVYFTVPTATAYTTNLTLTSEFVT
jgi:hypothetical protein